MNTGRIKGQNIGRRYELNGMRNGTPLNGTVMLDGSRPGWRCDRDIGALATLGESSGEIHRVVFDVLQLDVRPRQLRSNDQKV